MEDHNPQSKTSSRGFLAQLRRLVADRRGVGAVEFALIAPILISLYITSFEITIGLSVSTRLTRATSTIADLVTRETTVSQATLATMKNVADGMFAPYKVDDPNIRITGVVLDATGNPTVAWSWSNKGGAPYAVGSPVNVPGGMRVANSFLIRSEVSITHELLMFMTGAMPSGIKEIHMGREYFYRQRMGTSIPCTNCAT
ncbi:TadE/TadG family type IV pilus assembly protein [Rhizobium terrae]|uniref:TadE/TadG family type IV pilus assembly protein n=1 Tax=Rhizobium terrae TaxID=2171756 RepID=UPI000E3C4FBE|nr:TadE/TadG family type IV pilus assembly protein [Rhizobium terrae]